MNRALLVGINDYPADRLRSCVNDIEDMTKFLLNSCHFSSSDIMTLTDHQANKQTILLKLRKLVENLKRNDRILFYYSGHGVQFPSTNSKTEIDGLNEAICPIEFSWNLEETCILDKEIYEILSVVPSGINFIWISDSCYSGDLCKLVSDYSIELKTINPPEEIMAKIGEAYRKGICLKSFTDNLPDLNLAFISACKSDQTAIAKKFNNRFNGVLTYFLLNVLQSPNGLRLPITTIMDTVSNEIETNGFQQKPTITGSDSILINSFFNL